MTGKLDMWWPGQLLAAVLQISDLHHKVMGSFYRWSEAGLSFIPCRKYITYTKIHENTSQNIQACACKLFDLEPSVSIQFGTPMDIVSGLETFFILKYQHFGTSRQREWLILHCSGEVSFFRVTKCLGMSWLNRA